MSTKTARLAEHDSEELAQLFAALGDGTRLALVEQLGEASSLSITRLTAGTNLTRQAITKHLRVLQGAGLVTAVRRGREKLFQLEPQPIEAAKNALDEISRQWNHALARLKAFVEE